MKIQFRGFAILLTLLTLGLSSVSWAAEPAAPDAAPPMEQYLQSVLESCDRAEKQIPELTKLAETVAERHAAGGVLGVIWEPRSATGPQGPQYELRGRSGGMMAFDANLLKALPTASREKDVALIGWQRAPGPQDLEILKKYREKFFVIAFGPRDLPELAEHVKLADAWIDTGAGADDRAVVLKNGARVGRRNALLNVLNSWVFLGEVVAALTRRGKMPTMLQSHAAPGAKAWNDRYRQKLLFHDDITVPPVPAGTLSRRFLNQIRALTRQFAASQAASVGRAADYIATEAEQGRKTLVAQTGHTTYEHVGQYEDRAWATPTVLYDTAGRLAAWPRETADSALVLRLGYSGEDQKILNVLRGKQQRVLLVASTKDPRPDFQIPADLSALIDMGWDFGDAGVEIEGYPIRIFPPSGALQLIAYEAVNVEVLARLAEKKP